MEVDGGLPANPVIDPFLVNKVNCVFHFLETEVLKMIKSWPPMVSSSDSMTGGGGKYFLSKVCPTVWDAVGPANRLITSEASQPGVPVDWCWSQGWLRSPLPPHGADVVSPVKTTDVTRKHPEKKWHL